MVESGLKKALHSRRGQYWNPRGTRQFMDQPLVSIIIPTYKRADLLPCAVTSALSQTYANIELVVSDDEDPPGEAWAYLCRQADSDPRLRHVRNTGKHGQAYNTNNALRHARGAWIKPLHDDDRLLPQCIERFMRYCRGREHIALAGCHHFTLIGDRRLEPNLRGLPPAELIAQKYLHLGMYLIDSVVSGPPTTMFINRRAIEAGGFMVEDDPIRYFADSRWVMEIVRYGDSAMINEPLVEYFQGEHLSLSSEFKHKPDEMDDELLELRRLMREAIPPEVPAPPLETVRQMISIIRMFSQLKARRPGQALRRALRAWRPAAWWYACRCILRRRYPARFHETPRQLLLPVDP